MGGCSVVELRNRLPGGITAAGCGCGRTREREKSDDVNKKTEASDEKKSKDSECRL